MQAKSQSGYIMLQFFLSTTFKALVKIVFGKNITDYAKNVRMNLGIIVMYLKTAFTNAARENGQQ